MSLSLRAFRRKRETRYKSWEDEDVLEVDVDCQFNTASLEQQQRVEMVLGRGRRAGFDETDGLANAKREYGSTNESIPLPDSFYLGSYDMTGRTVKGKGCIDEPAAAIWKQTQEQEGSGRVKMRRKQSLPTAPVECSPKYVRLVIGQEQLLVVDNYTDEVVNSFNYRQISFTGTHPKYSRLFCFVAWETQRRTPFCHAFKCEDAAAAKLAAVELSNVFQKKMRELQRPPFKKCISHC